LRPSEAQGITFFALECLKIFKKLHFLINERFSKKVNKQILFKIKKMCSLFTWDSGTEPFLRRNKNQNHVPMSLRSALKGLCEDRPTCSLARLTVSVGKVHIGIASTFEWFRLTM